MLFVDDREAMVDAFGIHLLDVRFHQACFVCESRKSIYKFFYV